MNERVDPRAPTRDWWRRTGSNPSRRSRQPEGFVGSGPKPALSGQPRAGGGGRDRTDDLVLAKHALSQLSYAPRSAMARPVTAAPTAGQGRLELPTPRVSRARPNPLSYLHH